MDPQQLQQLLQAQQSAMQSLPMTLYVAGIIAGIIMAIPGVAVFILLRRLTISLSNYFDALTANAYAENMSARTRPASDGTRHTAESGDSRYMPKP
jgi:hypothetical protein